ncbi:acetate--CoA ligase family protein [Bengtsoniella intestinalis]|uniref:acetate--CoA ligase family protein n=1 Tax=Bengtsoniella intestinalis TaxID=3073143 RepID=UPI00391F43F1
MNLEKLLNPRSVAIVGATEKPGFGGDTTRNYLQFSKDLDHLYLVNPRGGELFGRKAYTSLAEIPEDVDMVILCTPEKTILGLLEEAAAKNCGGAVVFASGYGEVGAEGKIKEQLLIETANKLGIAIMGPNCGGFANYGLGRVAFAFLMEDRERAGNIGLVSQSGQIALSGLDTMHYGFSYVISSGNSCNVSVEEYLEFLVDDDGTKVVCAYMESVKKPAALARLLDKAARKKKPVVLLKTGRSTKSQELAASHTGALSGSDKVLRAMFKRYGVIEADDIEEMYSLALTFSTATSLPKGDRIVYMNVSGGEAGVTADLVDDFKLPLAEYNPETKAKLQSLVPSYGSVNNPFDMTAGIGYNTPAMVEAMEAISADENVDAICIDYTITPQIWDQTIAYMVKAVSIVREKETMKPVFWLPFVSHSRHVESIESLAAAGVPMLPTGLYGCRVLRKVLDFANFEYQPFTPSMVAPVGQTAKALSEVDSLCFLEKHGVVIPPQATAANTEEAMAQAKILGYPLSAKVDSPDILHKSDVGGVKLNIRNDAELCAAFDAIMESCTKAKPDAMIHGVLLKPMLELGAEMIIGVNNDKDFGPMIVVGMGGVFVELLHDVQMRPAPVNHQEAMEMLEQLVSYPLLTGYRGSQPKNVQALADLLVSISQMASQCADQIKELDINPVFVTQDGVSIADALLIVYEDGQ